MVEKHGTLDWKSKAPVKSKKPPKTQIGELGKEDQALRS